MSGQQHRGAPADPGSPLSPARSREDDIISLAFTRLWKKCTESRGSANPLADTSGTSGCGGGMERLGNHPAPAEARQDETGPHGARGRVRMPTWDVEMARGLLVGGGGRLAVGQHREAGRAPAAFAASRRKSKGSGRRAGGKQSRAEHFKRGSVFPASPVAPARGAARALCPGQGVRPPLVCPASAKEQRQSSLLLPRLVLKPGKRQMRQPQGLPP